MSRHAAAVTSISWIPSEAIEDAPMLRAPFEIGVLHYDDPPPARLAPDAPLRELADDDVFRFAHRLAAAISVEDGRIVDARYQADSRGSMGGTTVRIGGWATRTGGISLPLLQHDPVIDDTSATFVQSYGGRTGLPAPRRVPDRPRARWQAPVVWTTLRLTLHADGRTESELAGASEFPRHWLYGPDGELVAKSAVTAFTEWYRGSHGVHTPWGVEDRPVVTIDAETDLERFLAASIMRSGTKPEIRSLEPGESLIEQGHAPGPIYLVLDGVVAVVVDGREVGELGPGAVVGERAHLEGGRRTATLRAVTRVRCAAARFDQVDPALLQRLTAEHRREDRESG